MVQCEMCGAETSDPKTIKVEGAELDVCSDCTDFGTQVKTGDSSSSSSTKYSTSSSSNSSSKSGGSGGSSGSSKRRRRDMFDEMEEIASDYDERIRNAREAEGLSQEELAKDLSEKASLVRKLERGEMLPTDDVQQKLEKRLGISLTESTDGDDEWSGGDSEGGLTLGDVVKRKD
ncbi:multiprotein bridging factor aMBF1 [Halospeciosus flavus]|uniref:Multiprotein bridging factor aMBF1 n=1 Tax=Halospeciosus flavus TaxID=3032283 RepID=A0ABD5Z356_9EURY|nr:multiprotein bridging factor aMBF1 [Halospeciosus flavus]